MGRSRGFTLIELMIVIVIIGVLAAIAYPSYNNYLIKARRADAQSLMTEIASKEAQYIFDARAYTTTIGTGGLGIARNKWTCAATCTSPYYTVSIAADNTATPPTFLITAAPVAGSTQAGDGNQTLSNTGAKTGTW